MGLDCKGIEGSVIGVQENAVILWQSQTQFVVDTVVVHQGNTNLSNKVSEFAQ